ncbi:MAG: YeeE/YedE thiosulfate transporter family protein [Gammaproteobacteria bacterium]|jgi:uncharacterized membrane protein YedE/YeeE
MEYWSWWIGALALGIFAVIYGLLTSKPLGVSGSWLRIANWRDDKDLKEAEDFFEDKDAAADDLMAATLAEFGDDVIKNSDEPEVIQNTSTPAAKSATVPAGAHLVFLASMFLGSFITTMLHGGFEIQFELSEIHTRIFGDTWEVWASLFCGGVMVGFGTQMAGGCTSGHGLSGCAQFVPASLLSTVIFMSSAIVLSLFMKLTSLA